MPYAPRGNNNTRRKRRRIHCDPLTGYPCGVNTSIKKARVNETIANVDVTDVA
jgi:hypothetical protein